MGRAPRADEAGGIKKTKVSSTVFVIQMISVVVLSLELSTQAPVV